MITLTGKTVGCNFIKMAADRIFTFVLQYGVDFMATY